MGGQQLVDVVTCATATGVPGRPVGGHYEQQEQQRHSE
jgi:hypothetical protein